MALTRRKIQIRNGTAAEWTSANPILKAGELGVETDTRKMKVGNGSTAWTSLLYLVGGAGSATWGSITGTLSSQTDLQTELDGKSDVGHSHVISDVTDLSSELDSKRDILENYTAKTANYTIASTDYLIECTSGTFTVTLLTASGRAGKEYVIKNSGSGVITVATTSSQTIDGDLTFDLYQYDCLRVHSNGSNWIIT